MAFLLQNRIALITGGSKKLGSAIAWNLAKNGARVIINYRHSEKEAKQLVSCLIDNGFQASSVYADITKPKEIKSMIEKIGVDFGSIDILINNVGPWTEYGLNELDPDQYDEIMDANVKGSLYCSQFTFPFMKLKRWGRIINISATSCFYRNHSVYGLAKNAINVLTQSLAIEFAPYVTVNAIAPGLIEDPSLLESETQKVRDVTPLQRLPTFEEISHLILLMCGPEFDLVTGQVIAVDGGAHLQKSPWI